MKRFRAVLVALACATATACAGGPSVAPEASPAASVAATGDASTQLDGLFERYHGELLIICLVGGCTVMTEKQSADLREGDQVLLCDGEPFRVDRRAADDAAVVQLVWMPGPNPCRTCWEANGRFFETS